jgi:hypothetical protein
MGIEQTLLQESEESKRWLNLDKDESTYKRDLAKRIELINWVLENMKKPDIQICALIESKITQKEYLYSFENSRIKYGNINKDFEICNLVRKVETKVSSYRITCIDNSCRGFYDFLSTILLRTRS